MNRDEHLSWCKKRALEYVNRGDGKNAIASMISDLSKHPETSSSAGLGAMLAFAIDSKDMPAVRSWVEGFN
jgi:hypothetical protein